MLGCAAITGYEKTQSNQVCYFLFFGVFIVSKNVTSLLIHVYFQQMPEIRILPHKYNY